MKTKILVRIDDVSDRMNEERFMEYIAFFYSLGIKPMLGVIPQCEDEEMNYGKVERFWEKMRNFKADGYIIAMHGCKHVYTTSKRGLVSLRPLSEFSGIPLQKQIAMIRESHQIMQQHGMETKWFMAPGHSYDMNTILALRENGFSYITDGKARRVYMMDGITFVPATSTWKYHWYGGVLTICLHPNTDSERSFAQMKAFISANIDKVTTFEKVIEDNAFDYRLSRIEELIIMALDYCRETLIHAIKKVVCMKKRSD